MRISLILLAASTAFCSAAHAQVVPAVGGTVAVTISGNFKTPVTSSGRVSCKVNLALVPNSAAGSTTGGLGIAALTAGLGAQSAGAEATIANGGITNNNTNFSCSVTIPYRWLNIDPTTTSMAIFYSVAGTNPNSFDPQCLASNPPNPLSCFVPGTFPGKKQALYSIIPMPPAATTTNIAISNNKL